MPQNNQITALQRFYVIHEDFGELGIEATVNERRAYRETVISDLATGEFRHPIQIVEVDLSAGTVTDVSQALLDEAQDLYDSWRMGERNDALWCLDQAIGCRKIWAAREARKTSEAA